MQGKTERLLQVSCSISVNIATIVGYPEATPGQSLELDKGALIGDNAMRQIMSDYYQGSSNCTSSILPFPIIGMSALLTIITFPFSFLLISSRQVFGPSTVDQRCLICGPHWLWLMGIIVQQHMEGTWWASSELNCGCLIIGASTSRLTRLQQKFQTGAW